MNILIEVANIFVFLDQKRHAEHAFLIPLNGVMV